MKKPIRIFLSVALVCVLAIAAYSLFLKQRASRLHQGTLQETDAIEDIKALVDTSSTVPDEKSDLIVVDTPAPNVAITSPLHIRGKARGTWFFEASFPIVLVDWDGKIIAEGYASAVLDPYDPNSTWMTEDFVPFEGTLEFENPSFPSTEAGHFSKNGALILQKDNPSGIPEYDDALEIPVIFE